MKKRILITGASGFLGKKVLEKLDKNYEIIILEHKRTSDNKKNYQIIKGDLLDSKKWGTKLKRIDIIIHLAGVTHSKDPNMYKLVNLTGTANLVERLQRQGVSQFIYISTRAIGAGSGPYGESKKEAEEFIKKSKIKYTIFRVGEAYDMTFQTREGLGNIYKLVKNNFVIPYPASTKITLAPIRADDVARGIVAAIENKNAYGKTYVLAGPEKLTLYEVLTRISNHLNVSRIFLPFPASLLKGAFWLTQALKITSTSDQLDRLLCKKDGLSRNVWEDLKIKPEKFLPIQSK